VDVWDHLLDNEGVGNGKKILAFGACQIVSLIEYGFLGRNVHMSLKVHMLGPRDDKFPYKAQGSWYVKLDNKTHSYLQDRMIENGETLEEALLNTIMEGIELMKKDDTDEPTGPENTD
jgi:hypothetical protein